jgi:CheY-like chemotaxis protein
MPEFAKRRIILMADDDAEDCQLVRDALSEAAQSHDLRTVRDGEELLEYLRHCGQYAGAVDAPRPDLILLDFKMPRKDGREALREIKADPLLRLIPVVVLSTSTIEDDIAFSYDKGANSFITKPATFRQWVEIAEMLGKYWFDVVALPPSDYSDHHRTRTSLVEPEPGPVDPDFDACRASPK